MDNFSQNVLAVVMLLAAVAIVVVNDRIKERAQRKVIEKGRRPPARWANHKTSWPLVATYVVFAALFLLAAAMAPGRAMSRRVIFLVILSSFGLVALGGWVWRRMGPGRSGQNPVAVQPCDAADPAHAIASGSRPSVVGTLIRLLIDAIRTRRLPTIVWTDDGRSAILKCPRCKKLVELRMGANGERAFECSACGESGVWRDLA